MRRIIVTVVLIVAALVIAVPPFFTHGACTAEFDATAGSFEGARAELATLEQARAWLAARAIGYLTVPADRCDNWPSREALECHGGPVLLIARRVSDPICRYYRDPTIRVQLGFNSHQQLVKVQTDMNPYKILKMPALGLEIYYAK